MSTVFVAGKILHHQQNQKKSRALLFWHKSSFLRLGNLVSENKPATQAKCGLMDAAQFGQQVH